MFSHHHHQNSLNVEWYRYLSPENFLHLMRVQLQCLYIQILLCGRVISHQFSFHYVQTISTPTPWNAIYNSVNIYKSLTCVIKKDILWYDIWNQDINLLGNNNLSFSFVLFLPIFPFGFQFYASSLYFAFFIGEN